MYKLAFVCLSLSKLIFTKCYRLERAMAKLVRNYRNYELGQFFFGQNLEKIKKVNVVLWSGPNIAEGGGGGRRGPLLPPQGKKFFFLT